MLDLYHWEPNGVFLKPLMALEEKQAAYTSHWFDPTRFEQIAAVFPSSVESQLQLEREGHHVADETVISARSSCSVLAPRRCRPRCPRAPYDRYRARVGPGTQAPVGPHQRTRLRVTGSRARRRDMSELRRGIGASTLSSGAAGWR
jgi:hypothetical protein